MIQEIFSILIVRVIDITFEGAEPPRWLYQLRVHSFSKCFVSWPNKKQGFPPVPVSFQKFIASSGIVLISFIKNDTFMFYCSPLPYVFLISQFACVKILQKIGFQIINLLTLLVN